MSFTATGTCFYCSNPINRRSGRWVYAHLTHQYKTGWVRHSDRNFHPACFEKFQDYGRPYNPHTEYTVTFSEERRGTEKPFPQKGGAA